MTDNYGRITPEHIEQAMYNLDRRRHEPEPTFHAAESVRFLAFALAFAVGGLVLNVLCAFAVWRAQSIGQDPLPWVLGTLPVMGLTAGGMAVGLWWARRRYRRLGGKF